MEEVLPPVQPAPGPQGVQVAVADQPTPAAGGAVPATRDFLLGVQTEMKRVTWPTWPELMKATRMIIILSIILGVAIGVVDLLLNLVFVRGVAAISQ